MNDIPKLADRKYFEKLEEERLSPCAIKSANTSRQYLIPAEGRHFNYRTEFQRDRDRILHSRSFRRLIHKTQVYLYQENDHYRTRMAHTLEVSQLSRVIARSLNLNEDLTEAISLGHDLGKGPFGIAGEKILTEIMAGKVAISGINKQSLKSLQPYNSSMLSLLIVDELEKRYSYDGLNLTDTVREGIVKHHGYKIENIDSSLKPGIPLFLEGQIATIAGSIADQAHNLEDGMRSGEIALPRVEALQIGKEVIKNIGSPYRNTRSSFIKQNMMVRGIIHLLVTSTILKSRENLDEWKKQNNIVSSSDFNKMRSNLPDKLISYSENTESMFVQLCEFVDKAMSNSNIVNRYEGKVRKVITGLLRTYYENPLQLENYFLIRYRLKENIPYLRDVPSSLIIEEIKNNYHSKPEFLKALCHHVAGMTDIYALKEFNRLINFSYQDF